MGLSEETKQHICNEFLAGKSISSIQTQVQVALWQDIGTPEIEAVIREEFSLAREKVKGAIDIFRALR